MNSISKLLSSRRRLAIVVAAFLMFLGIASVAYPVEVVNAAPVRCFAAHADGTGDEENCNEPGFRNTLLDYTGANSLDELDDKCFSIGGFGSWAEINCEDVARDNAAKCIKEDKDAGVYRDIECGNAGVDYNFEERTCYAINDSGDVTEYNNCQDRNYINLISGTYTGGRFDSDKVEPTCQDGLNSNDCDLSGYLTLIIRVLSGAVGIVVTIMIVWGGIQYTSARDNPQQAAQAKDHIRNALFALVFYIFSIAFLNYLIPGGVF